MHARSLVRSLLAVAIMHAFTHCNHVGKGGRPDVRLLFWPPVGWPAGRLAGWPVTRAAPIIGAAAINQSRLGQFALCRRTDGRTMLYLIDPRRQKIFRP